MFFSKEQREARRQIDEKINTLNNQLQQLQKQYDEHSTAYQAVVEAYVQSVSEKWEYLEFDGQKVPDAMLNNLGNQGWELVSVSFYDIIENNYRVVTFRYTFKRKKPSIPQNITSNYAVIEDIHKQINALSLEIEQLRKQR